MLFVDTGFFVALLDKNDAHASKARKLYQTIEGTRLITTAAVLIELLNGFGDRGPHLRKNTIEFVRKLHASPNVEIVALTQDLYFEALDYYERHRDKGYSHTDCLSFLIMNDRGIREALAIDHHFSQAGFRALLDDAGER